MGYLHPLQYQQMWPGQGWGWMEDASGSWSTIVEEENGMEAPTDTPEENNEESRGDGKKGRGRGRKGGGKKGASRRGGSTEFDVVDGKGTKGGQTEFMFYTG